MPALTFINSICTGGVSLDMANCNAFLNFKIIKLLTIFLCVYMFCVNQFLNLHFAYLFSSTQLNTIVLHCRTLRM